ncbi:MULTISPECIES: MATE family efflux transporter [unclassified Roseateles]|uniref:MATE family efflux transporter n=1 Tax=unclassified Roseateles TaxID=2626991 RepID=UPI000700137F|nr:MULTISPECIES: MATE family efflux transporter [unclassified Roseateles]KQW41266.1 MATE family efflux transporter [Pelomonas sp. Root405]KRA68037.1 MATE family efflux transporter [Pelomonas sp. Root662]
MTAPFARPRLFALTWPMLLELLLGIGIGVIGTGLAARLSDNSGAAFGLANQVFAALFVLFRVIGAGVSVAVTQALGAGRRDQADAVARAVVGASTWLGLGGAVAALIAAGPLLALVNAPPEVAPLAQMLLQALAPALMLDAWNANMSSVMRSHLRSREALFVVVVIQVITLVVALLTMPSLGLVGYALACAVGRGVGLVMHILLWRTRLDLRLRASDWWRLVRAPLATVLHIGIPGAAENISWRLAFMTSLAAVAQLGAHSLATHAYTMQFLHVILMFSLAISFAVEIMVGHMIGAGRLHAANRLVRRSLALGIVLALVVSCGFALAGPWLLTRFTADPAIIALGCTLLWWTVLVEPGRSFNLVVINALRAAGDARYPVMVGTASMAIVLAGGSWFLGVHLGWGLVGVWIAYAADEWIRGLLMWRRWATLGWLPHARAAHRRLRHSRVH